MGGPGVDPHWNGTPPRPSAWGARQAARALADIANGQAIDYPVVWEDIEMPGIGPATDNGWNTVYTSPCSGRSGTAASRRPWTGADFSGFASYITAHSKYKVGVYSAAGVWKSIFGTGAARPRSPNTVRVDVRARDRATSATPRPAGA